jgi:glycosyltransferase involved in cell wall biosynthesis
MIRGRDILLISSIDWGFLWQGPQEIALRFARAGNRVLYLENTGVRSPGFRDLRRVRMRFSRWAQTLPPAGLRPLEKNLYVLSPLVLPAFGPAWRRWLNRCLFLPAISKAARRLGMRDALIWTYLPTDTVVDLIRRLRSPKGLLVYHCAADFSQLTPHVGQLQQSERALLSQSDLVFAICDELREHCLKSCSEAYTFPYGVDLAAFPLEETENLERPSHPNLPRPVIGYVGGLHRHVDFELLDEMIRARPLWSWVFVGSDPVTSHPLAGFPNVHLVEQQPHGKLAQYIRSFDVGIVPYAKTIYTRTVVPVKINEYLALGKPVVATDIRPVVEFNEQHRVLLTSDNKSEGFLAAIGLALGQAKDPALIARRRDTAALSDWPARLAAMSALVERKLREKGTQVF